LKEILGSSLSPGSRDDLLRPSYGLCSLLLYSFLQLFQNYHFSLLKDFITFFGVLVIFYRKKTISEVILLWREKNLSPLVEGRGVFSGRPDGRNNIFRRIKNRMVSSPNNCGWRTEYGSWFFHINHPKIGLKVGWIFVAF